ncbi:MAG: hypothetical protein H7039_21995, partial [Bryobacteraceae bacterium]|nr:hypothetical protein [Bryobacteraceae bacterium]
MIPSHRQWFNDSWTPEKYATFLRLLGERVGEPARFRHSETPIFVDSSLVDRMATAGREILEQLLENSEYQRASAEAIPPKYRVPNEASHPLFVQADFGLDENLNPKLVEIQGFPSLYAYQPVMSECYREAYEIDTALSTLPDRTTSQAYVELLGKAVCGTQDPENVFLLEVQPETQKTHCDFVLTERLFGVRAIDIESVKKRGNKLYAPGDVPIHRIYNRAIVDEIERKGVQLGFDWRDDLDVEWAGHPNWFFRLSKFSLPYLDHPAVPRTMFARPVDDPERWVLKPLYSFAGLGVIVGPTKEQVAKASPEEYILQERVDFRPVI